jgi:hypothetical protein
MIIADLAQNETIWVTLVKYFGVPGAIFLVWVWAIYKGWFSPKREVDKIEAFWKSQYDLGVTQYSERLKLTEAQCVASSKQWEDRYEELKAESIQRLESLRVDKDMWRDTALRATNIAKVVTDKLPTGGGQ